MALKALIKADEHAKLPKEIQAYYVSSGDDGEFVLDVDESEYKKKVNEFRDSNRVLSKEKQNLEKERERLQLVAEKYKDIDPDRAREAMTQMQELEKIAEKDLIKAGKFDEVITKRTEAMRTELETKARQAELKKTEAEEQATTYRQKHDNLLRDTAITNMVLGIGQVRKGAMGDILRRGRELWSVTEDGKLSAKDLYNAKGDPMTLEDWGQALLTESSFLFESSGGGGAAGGKKKDMPQGTAVVDRDPMAIGRNLESIASGKAIIRQQ